MFSKIDNCLVIDKNVVNDLFTALGCVNVGKWDDDIVVQRLRRIAMFCDDDVNVGKYEELINNIRTLPVAGTIILRNVATPKDKPLSILDDYDSGKIRRRSGKKRKRGEKLSFRKCGIPKGATLHLKRDPSITCKVIGDPLLVDFGDKGNESFTARTRKLLGVKETTFLSPMHYWLYNGKLLRWYYQEVQCKAKKKVKSTKNLTKK